MSDDQKEKLAVWGKNTVIPIHLGLLTLLVWGVWEARGALNAYEDRLESLERSVGDRWSYHMEDYTWNDFLKKNPGLVIPDVKGAYDRYISRLR